MSDWLGDTKTTRTTTWNLPGPSGTRDCINKDKSKNIRTLLLRDFFGAINSIEETNDEFQDLQLKRSAARLT